MRAVVPVSLVAPEAGTGAEIDNAHDGNLEDFVEYVAVPTAHDGSILAFQSVSAIAILTKCWRFEMCQFANRVTVIRATMFAVIVAAAYGGPPSATHFTYQGELKQSDVPVNAACDFAFSLWDGDNEPDPRTQIESTIPATIFVENGLFQVPLDFGPTAFNGGPRWLHIEVCCSSPCSPSLIPLTPRQELTPVPNALALRGLWTQQNAASPNLIGGHSENVVDDAPGDPGPGDPTISDPAEDGSLAHPFDTVQEAIDAAGHGTTISIDTGVYDETGTTVFYKRGEVKATGGQVDID